MSWIQNEHARGEEAKTYQEEVLRIPLPIREKSDNPKRLYYDWQKLLYHPYFKPKILALGKEIYKEFEAMRPSEAQSTLGHVARRWNNIT